MYLNGTSLFYRKIGCLKCCQEDIKNGYGHKFVFIAYEKAKLRM